LACVRRSLAEMDVFVFTLGLTECWEDVEDGAIFPIAPGVAGGAFDAQKIRFRNFDETDCWSDLKQAITLIREINPAVRIVLTVSPVPLAATYENRHVLLSTTWSKAVLRIVAEKAVRQFDLCAYFPSYEIITSPHLRGRYFADDCREVLPAGVDHVMRVFRKTFVGPQTGDRLPSVPRHNSHKTDIQFAEIERDMELLCDELMLDERARTDDRDSPNNLAGTKAPLPANYRLPPWATRIARFLLRK
jgi:GSCFA family